MTPRHTSDDTGDNDRFDLAPRERDARTLALLVLASQTTNGVTSAKQRGAAVKHNIRLAHGVASRYTRSGAEIDDLQQVAVLALILATNRFDPRLGTPFPAYARLTINGELKKHLRDHAWAVRPPRSLHDLFLDVGRATEHLTQLLGRTPKADDIARYLGVSIKQVHQAGRVAAAYSATSLEGLTQEFPDASPGQHLNIGVVPSIDTALTRMALRRGLKDLTPRSRLILRLRFENDMTQLQIAHQLGISQMQVSRLLAEIFTRLRSELRENLDPPPPRRPEPAVRHQARARHEEPGSERSSTRV